MIRVRQVKVGLNDDLVIKIASKLKIKPSEIESYQINKQSIDARKELFYVYEVDVQVKNENKYLKLKDVIKIPDERYNFKITGTQKLNNRPVIVGSGPAGLFCAYFLSENGYKPIVIERGEEIEKRVKTVQEFWKTGKLNLESNVQFGEGGAGTFSDGKLNTLVKDFRIKKVLEILVENGAPEEILYLNKPHIGTDLLRKVVVNIRNKIINNGGTFYYSTCLTNLVIQNNKLTAIEINHEKILPCDLLVLAIGHSSRDTFEMLEQKNLKMEAKPFALGIRIQHPQKMIDENQYGSNYKLLPRASYKLTYTSSNKRGVYSFCMCPGGYVVNASSEKNRLAINGMSNHKRDSLNSNSAIIVTVTPKDFGFNPLDGIKFQRDLESKAYKLGKGQIPIQLFGDFVDNKISTSLGQVQPLFKGDYTLTNLNLLYPDYICEALKEGIKYFDNKINGFARKDAIIAGVESRTSSPVRIIRNEEFISNIDGIYPCGEGAGYAGGITTSAIDGIKVFEKIGKKYNC